MRRIYFLLLSLIFFSLWNLPNANELFRFLQNEESSVGEEEYLFEEENAFGNSFAEENRAGEELVDFFPCHGSCQSCTGPLDTDCSICKTGLLRKPDGTCGCVEGAFFNPITYTCEGCSNGCIACAPNNVCLACQADMTNSDGVCECNEGTIWNGIGCQLCLGTCQLDPGH